MSEEETQQLELLAAPQKLQILKGTFNPAPGTRIWIPEISQKKVQRSADMSRWSYDAKPQEVEKWRAKLPQTEAKEE